MDYDDDLPNLDHWKPVMEFTVEQAALLLAGIDPFDTNLEHARRHGLPRWKQAWAHSLAIVSAIRQGLISPVICRAKVVDPHSFEGWELITLKPADRDHEISIGHTIITRASLVGWVAAERVQFAKPRPPHPAPAINKPVHMPATIEAKPEPLALPYHGHKSEGLEFVDDAIKQLWSTYDPDDQSTAPTKEMVVDYLRSKGAGVNMAEAVNLILRPRNLRKVGLKNSKVPTRESQ
ncbi:hypothetical protein [Azotobacter beijerinckii]|uniref:hypothetical protein n=1 Tax=Azotobacter beijerinckii TaxID=170623 RepID=UPI0029554A4A|nr:hypothetical protein [Azotobacter beijerinckii]MDV7210756.1 hypothetical protein [Azotobacter beijerinckii]